MEEKIDAKKNVCLNYLEAENKVNAYDVIILSLMYFGATFTQINSYVININLSLFRYLLIGLCSSYFLNKYLFRRLRINKYLQGNRVLLPYSTWTVLIIWSFFCISMIVSEIYNSEIPIDGILFLFFNTIIFIYIISSSIDNPKKTIALSSYIVSIVFIIISLIKVPFTNASYYGVFKNPNNLGEVSAFGAVGIFGILLVNYFKKQKINFIISLLLFVVNFVFVLFSSSRTSFMSLIITLLLTLLSYSITKNVSKKRLIGFTTITIILYLLVFKDIFFYSIINKFQKYSGDNLLSGRIQIWEQIIYDIKIWGNGENYFSDILMIGSHNTIFFILGTYGLFCALLFICFLILCYIKGIRYMNLNKDDEYSFIPFSFITLFILISLTENLFGLIGNCITLSFFNVLGLMSFETINNQCRGGT